MQARALPVGTRFLANRLLAAVALFGVLAGFLLIADRMTSAGLSSPLEITGAVAAALLTGIMFQANFPRVVRLVDRVFFPRRYAAVVAVEGIRASLGDRRQILARERAARECLAADVARALGLVSVAVFARSPDGGFMRQAAFGWPPGTAWHLLPEDALSTTLAAAPDVVLIPKGAATDVALPQAEARPGLAVILRRRGRAQSAILLGGDSSGRPPEIDTVRGLAALFGELVTA